MVVPKWLFNCINWN